VSKPKNKKREMVQERPEPSGPVRLFKDMEGNSIHIDLRTISGILDLSDDRTGLEIAGLVDVTVQASFKDMVELHKEWLVGIPPIIRDREGRVIVPVMEPD